jgi:hypothetical protein
VCTVCIAQGITLKLYVLWTIVVGLKTLAEVLYFTEISGKGIIYNVMSYTATVTVFNFYSHVLGANGLLTCVYLLIYILYICLFDQ